MAERPAPSPAPAPDPDPGAPEASNDGANTPAPLAPTIGLPTGTARTDPSPAKGEMPFLDHLEELRWRIFKALGGILVCVIGCLFFADWILDAILLAPTRASFYMYDVLRLDAVDVALQNRTITGQFFAFFGTVLAVGVLFSSPIVLYQVWKFVEPALYPKERHGMRFAAAFATFFFVLGASFGYLIITPVALQFFAQFNVSEQITNEFDISKYFSMVVTWAFGAGALFELPVVVTFLAKAGLITAGTLKVGRKYAFIIILVLGAIFTPPDPFSQILLATPLYGLYELAILLAGMVERQRLREEKAEAAAEAEAEAGAERAG